MLLKSKDFRDLNQPGVTVIWVPLWFMYPHTHITRDMSIPRGDIHSTGSEMIRSGRKSYIQYLYF